MIFPRQDLISHTKITDREERNSIDWLEFEEVMKMKKSHIQSCFITPSRDVVPFDLLLLGKNNSGPQRQSDKRKCGYRTWCSWMRLAPGTWAAPEEWWGWLFKGTNLFVAAGKKSVSLIWFFCPNRVQIFWSFLGNDFLPISLSYNTFEYLTATRDQ